MFAFPSFSAALLAAALSFHAGQQSFSFDAPALAAQLGVSSPRIHGVVWYPASVLAGEQPRFLGAPNQSLFDAGNVAAGAPVASTMQRYPLILLSHGTGGSAEQMAWVGTALARGGYIAVAIDHPGNNTIQKTVQGFSLWWLREAELSDALDSILANPTFGARVDRSKIGALGFSLGGFTVVGLAGAQVSYVQFMQFCAVHPSVAGDCGPLPEFPNLSARARALAARDPAYRRRLLSGGSYPDPRIQAVYAIAPAVAQAVTVASLQAIRIPVSVAYGSNDTTVAPAFNAGYYSRWIPHATAMTVPGAAHYTFLDTCTPLGKHTLPAICADTPGVDRDAVHAAVARDAIDFFTTHGLASGYGGP
jgi:predicted dienelactone hydrolase